MSLVVKSLPYHLQVYEFLKKSILNGEIKSGERIFENKISQELGVSRSPVREALRMLEQDELLTLTSGGLIVNPMDLDDMEEVYQCRMAVEPFAAKLATNKLEEDDLSQLKAFIAQARYYHQKNDYRKVVETNTTFHDLIIQKCGNERLRSIINKISALVILSRTAEFQFYQRPDDYLEEHEALLKVLREKNGDEAERIYRKHIENDFNYYREQYIKYHGNK